MFSAGEPSQPLSKQQLQSDSNRLSNMTKGAARSFRRFHVCGQQIPEVFTWLAIFTKSELFHQKLGLWQLFYV